jgi:hypothetical protein
MALAMMVRTRLWLAGEVSPHRDMPLLRQLIERVRRCAAHLPIHAFAVLQQPAFNHLRMSQTLRWSVIVSVHVALHQKCFLH